MDNSKYKYKVLTIPNILSFFRLALIPLFVALYVKNLYVAYLVVLGVSGVTDVIDGYIARHFGMISNVGRILDPVADKLTQIGVMACVCFKYHQMLIVLCLLVVKELANGIIGLIMMHRNRDALDSEWHGKLTTVVIYFTIVAHLLWRDNIPAALSYAMIALCVVTMIISFILYTVNNVKIIKNDKK